MKKHYEQLKRIYCTLSVTLLMGLATFLFLEVWARHYNAMTVFPYYFKGFVMMAVMYFLMLTFMMGFLSGSQIGFLRQTPSLLALSGAILGTNLFFYMVTDLLATFLVPVWWFLILTAAEIVILSVLSRLLNRIYDKVFPDVEMLLVYGDYPEKELRRLTANWSGKYKISNVISIKNGTRFVIRMIRDYDAVVICDLPVEARNIIAEYCQENHIPTYFTPRVSDMIFQDSDSLRFFDGRKGDFTTMQQLTLISYLKRVWKKGAGALYEKCNEVAGKKEKVFIVTANPETLMTALEAEEYNAILLDEDVTVVPDGIGLIKALQVAGYGKCERVPGVEFMAILLKMADAKACSVYFYGASQNTMDALLEKVKTDYPHLRIVGAKNGYDHDPDEAMKDAIEKKPDMVFVALGVPAQENLIARYFHQFEKGIFMGVGGSFDVISGCKKRAPAIFIRLNLEWLYRIIKEPGRIKRFWNNNVRFIWDILTIRKI